ncbi:MAG: formimidoylglutamase [Phycisphaeraceae bacterium]|nr:formimidoylglutamase [Phycisphaerales bacterium]MCB9860781.1 formimidoylglutamase [Phycisphaeraceae bacterium]
MISHIIPHTIEPVWPATRPGRAAHAFLVDKPGDAQIGLIGLADDLGIALNNGRPGAAEGPNAFRNALATYGTAHPMHVNWPKVFDAGNIISISHDSGMSDEDRHCHIHDRVTEATAAMLNLGLFPVAIGGGHDLTFPFIRAVSQHHKTPLNGVYFDAHLDVRDTIGSGMPFRRLIENNFASRLHVLGLNAHVNSREHADWFTSHGGTICLPSDDLATVLESWTSAGFASFDMDVIDAAHAPGVSALHPCGTDVRTAATWCEEIGACSHISAFDIMELSPPYDKDNRTARVAAHLFLSFLAGFARR